MTPTTYLPLLAFLVTLLAAQTAHADRTKVRVAPVQGWVQPIALQRTAQVPSSAAGRYDVLVDRQLRFVSKRHSRFSRFAQQVVSVDGIADVAMLRATFNPAYQRVDVHYVRVHRNGKVIDALELEQMRIAAVERDRQARLYSGLVEMSYEVPDVRVGDVVEYAYTVHGSNPVFRGAILGTLPLQFGVPVGRMYLRLLIPRGQTLSWKVFATYKELIRRRAGSYDEVVYSESDLEPLLIEGERPSWHFAWPMVVFSSYESWQDVARWAHAMYEPAMTSSRSIRARAAEITAAHATSMDRVRAATRFVQDDVRYVGVELGEHSHRPHTAGTVLKQRFGDCKDKAGLLVALLREMDITAAPALVDVDHGRVLGSMLPSPQAFDHVVVRAEVDGQVLWIDGTELRSRRGLELAPRYHRALVVDADTTTLATLPEVVPGEPTLDMVERYAKRDDGWTLTVQTEYRGFSADQFRRRLGRESLARISKSYLNAYAVRFPHIESVADIVVEDDEENNLIRAREVYTMPTFFDDGAREIDMADVTGILPKPSERKRSSPFALPYPTYHRLTVLVDVPAGGEHADSHRVSNEFFTYQVDAHQQGEILTVVGSVEVHQDHVPFSRTADYIEAVDEVAEHRVYSLDEPTDDALTTVEPSEMSWAGLGVVFGLFVAALGFVLVWNRRSANLTDALHRAASALPVYPRPAAGPVPLAPASNGYSVAALVLGLAGLSLVLVPGLNAIMAILSLLFGRSGLRRARLVGVGRNNSLAGIWLGVVVAVLAGIVLYIGITTGEWYPSGADDDY